MSGVLSRAGYSVHMALWWVTRQSASLSHSRPCHRMVNCWAIPHLVEPQHQAQIQALSLKGRGRGGVLPPGDQPFLWPSGGSSMRSPTTAAACTWWREATSAASPTGRPTAHACSRSAGCSTSSSPNWIPATQGGNKDPESGVLLGLGVLSRPLTGWRPQPGRGKPGGARKPTPSAPKA